MRRGRKMGGLSRGDANKTVHHVGDTVEKYGEAIFNRKRRKKEKINIGGKLILRRRCLTYLPEEGRIKTTIQFEKWKHEIPAGAAKAAASRSRNRWRRAVRSGLPAVIA